MRLVSRKMKAYQAQSNEGGRRSEITEKNEIFREKTNRRKNSPTEEGRKRLKPCLCRKDNSLGGTAACQPKGAVERYMAVPIVHWRPPLKVTIPPYARELARLRGTGGQL